MTRKFNYTSEWGTDYVISFVKSNYIHDNSCAVEVLCAEADEGCDPWEPYTTLTVNLALDLEPNQAALDTNNSKHLVEWCERQGWFKRFENTPSGFCVYPVVEFTNEFLNDICTTYSHV